MTRQRSYVTAEDMPHSHEELRKPLLFPVDNDPKQSSNTTRITLAIVFKDMLKVCGFK